ncbi:MAG: Bacteriohemerythrin [Planctomycetes bacterium ADurb.Bin401]|nr:MAG: Bacteriohemerythrin [Planctomycetes bacterium ADurb.Bin401]
MAFFEWTDELSIGVEKIDSQHKRLVEIINEYYEAAQSGQSEQAVREAVGKLINYAGTHFADEEKLMEEKNFPQIDLHKQMHKRLTEDVINFAEKLAKDEKIFSLEMAVFLKGWLENHIAQTDKKIGHFLTNQE